MSGAHPIDHTTDATVGDSPSPVTLDYEKPGEAAPHASRREMVEFGLMGLVYFLLPLLLLFVLQVLFPWL